MDTSKNIDFPPLKKALSLSPEMKALISDPVKLTDEQFKRMERQYLNEAHRAYSEACQKEVEEMAEQPLTHEQFLQQIAEQNRESELGN